MSHILESFKDWQNAMNEETTPDRVKLTNDINQKAIINPIDKSSFKVRAKWTDDLIDANGRLTASGFNTILTDIREYVDPATGQASLINYYSGLKDLNRNIVIYDVIRDTDTAKDPNPKIRKQSFRFTVASRELYPNIPKNVWYVHQEDVTKAQIGQPVGTNNTTSTGEVLTGADTFGIDFSRGAIYITNPNDPKMIQLIDSFYFKLSADDMLSNQAAVAPFRKALATELKTNALGDNSKTFILALNAAFSIVTRYGDPETGVTQVLVQKMKGAKSNAPGAQSAGIRLSEISDFNSAAFVSNLKPISDIKVPTGGFIKGKAVKDNEFAKFQKLLAVKFQKSLGNSKIYKNFAKFEIGGADGTYGPNTAALVGLLKKALIDPKWTGNMDKNNVDQAFVDRINQEKVTESYLALDGFTLIVEGIDMGAVDAYEAPSAGNIGGNRGVDSVKSDTVVKGDKYFLQGKDGYAYFVKDKVWYYTKDGGKSTILLNPTSIAKLMKLNPKVEAYYILTYAKTVGVPERANKHIYKLDNKVWYVQLAGSNSWQQVEKGSDLDRLKSLYPSSGSTSNKAGKLSLDTIKGLAHTLYVAMKGTGTITREIYGVYRQIKSYSDLAALHTAFKKEPGAEKMNLSAWLYDDLDKSEWKELFAILKKNGLVKENDDLRLQLAASKKDGKAKPYYEAYMKLYQTAAAKSK